MLSVLRNNQKNLSLGETVRKGNKRYACRGAMFLNLGAILMVTEQALSRDPQPAQIAPTGDGYMPLYCAAQWIATAGHAVPWDVPADELWCRDYRLLCDAIASEDVKLVGDWEGETKPVPPHLLASCEISHHASLFIPSEGNYYLSSCPYIDEVRWREGVDDTLVGRGGRPNWHRLVVRKADIHRIWPFRDAKESIRTTRTGARGRPSSSVALLREHLERLDDGRSFGPLKDEALALWEWLRSRHPGAALPLAKSIEDIIREQHRAQKLKAGK
jgi:hypothetical protein